MHLRGYTSLLLVAILLCSTCCGVPYMIYSAVTPQHVVKPVPPVVTKYQPDGVYHLMRTVFLIKSPNRVAEGVPQFVIVPPSGYSGGPIPPTPEDYDANPKNWPEVVAVLRVGQRIQFRTIRPVLTHVYANPFLPGDDRIVPYPLFLLPDSKLEVGLVDGSVMSEWNGNPSSYYLSEAEVHDPPQ